MQKWKCYETFHFSCRNCGAWKFSQKLVHRPFSFEMQNISLVENWRKQDVSAYLRNQLTISGKTRKWLLKAFLKTNHTHTNIDKEGKEKQEATGSLANAKEISTDSAVEVAFCRQDGILTSSKDTWRRMFTVREECFSSNFCNVFVQYHEASHGANAHLALPLAPIRSQALLLIWLDCSESYRQTVRD